MKKEGIQTRNRKMTSKTRRSTASSLSRHVSSIVDATSSRHLFNLRPATGFYDRAPYYQHHTSATAAFSVQPGLPVPETGFYPTQAVDPQRYRPAEYREGYQMVAGDTGMGYAAPSTHSYLSAVASSQQYLSAAAAGFHRHLHDLL